MTDKIMAILALGMMIGFLSTVVVFVPDVDLIVVIVLVSVLAIYDFWDTLRNKTSNPPPE